MQGVDKEMVRSIYTLSDSELRRALINRNLKNLESNSHGYDAKFNGETRVKIPGSPDAMVFKLQSKYSRSSSFSEELQDICFGEVPHRLSCSISSQRSVRITASTYRLWRDTISVCR